jgi:hypothetical protein
MRNNLEKGMRLDILNCQCCPEPMAVAEANAQQAFVDVLDTGVISPLATFKVNESLLGVHLSDNRRTGRKPQRGQERELKETSRYPLRSMLIMLRIEYRSSKRHTSRNITLCNTHSLMVAFVVLRTFQTTGFVVSRTVRKNLSVQNLKMVLPITFDNLVH